LLAVAAILGAAATTSPVRADEPADRGISLSVAAGGASDGAPIVGASTVGNLERAAIGGAVDAMPGAPRNGRLSLSVLLGYQQQIGRTRFHLMGEAGGHRSFEAGTTSVGSQAALEVWPPFAGVRLGVARTVPAHGLVEVGASLFGRHDLDRAGGVLAGLTLQVGIRLESPHPWNQGVVEP
jgi:hypothetical protein